MQAESTSDFAEDLRTSDHSKGTAETKDSWSWLKRARIISAIVYILLLLAYLIFIITCIVLYPRCERASETPWWINGVFVRFSTRTKNFNDLSQQLDAYQNNFSMQAVWLSTVLPLSSQSNPLGWTNAGQNPGDERDLIALVNKAHDSGIRIVADYPLNHLSIQSPRFRANDYPYFVWNDQGNASNWKTADNMQRSAWTYNGGRGSFYLHQFDDSDAIDVNFRNNRVFDDVLQSFSYWEKNVSLDGFNIQGISHAYEDYEYRDEAIREHRRTRHLEEDYLLLARIRLEIDAKKILMLDSMDSRFTSNEQSVARYFGDQTRYLGGVQVASVDDYVLTDARETNVTAIFDRYYGSSFYREKRTLVWSSLSSNSKLNEAFFAASLFHSGAILIDVSRREQQFADEQLARLRQLIQWTRTLDVFRVGRIEQRILSDVQWLTVERARRGSKHHMIIINFGDTEQSHDIELKEGITNAVEVLISNIADPGAKYETNALIDVTKPIQLRPFEYLIIRWSPSIEGLGIAF